MVRTPVTASTAPKKRDRGSGKWQSVKFGVRAWCDGCSEVREFKVTSPFVVVGGLIKGGGSA